jgi:hypothetical protein
MSKKMCYFKLKQILSSIDFQSENYKDVLDELNNNLEIISKINEFKKDDKDKIIKMIVRIKPEFDSKYSDLYYELAKVPELWKIPSFYGMTLLSYICYGYEDVFYNCLNELTKYPNLWKIQDGQYGYTPLHYILLSYTNYEKMRIEDIVEKLSTNYDLWRIRSKNYETPFHILCKNRNIFAKKCISNLIQDKELWKYGNNDGITPLHYLCSIKDKQNIAPVLEYLSDLKFDDLWKNRDNIGYTPFHIICRFANDKEYEKFFDLMKNRCDLWAIKNDIGMTPQNIYDSELCKRVNDEYEIIE